MIRKLLPETLAGIKHMLASTDPKYKQKEIAAQFNVSQALVSNVKTGKIL
jgi:predicted XRE-type DNA-binding protein